MRREPRDAWFGWILAVALVGVVLGAANFYFVWVFYSNREQQQQIKKSSNYPIAPPGALSRPVGPRLEQLYRLEGVETNNFMELEAAAEQQLNSYGPTDQQGFVHIPISEAMKLVVPQLPVRKQSQQQATTKDNGLRFGGEPNSGRVFREESR